MNTTQTGIAVALAVIVVSTFLVFPSLSPFQLLSNSNAPAAALTGTEPMPTNDQLQMTDQAVGTGAVAEAGDTIAVNYVGMLADGTVFDASANHGGPQSFSIGVGQVIPGWDQGIVGMKEGGKRTLVIPPSLAYGDAGFGSVIPPGATLTFQVELVKVTKPAK